MWYYSARYKIENEIPSYKATPRFFSRLLIFWFISNNPDLQNINDGLWKQISQKYISLTSCNKDMFYDITRFFRFLYKSLIPLNDQTCHEKQFYISFIRFPSRTTAKNECIICIYYVVCNLSFPEMLLWP